MRISHVFPDTVTLHLPAAVTNFTPADTTFFPAARPGNGSILRLDHNNFGEVIGALTGSGAVIGNTGGATLIAGFGAAGDFTFDGIFKNTNGQNPALVKVGGSKMTLTNTSDSTGHLYAYQGDLALAGVNGKWTGGELRLGKSGTLTFDNSVVAITDRQSTLGSGNRWLSTAGGGEFRLIGHATQVADVTLFGIGNSAGTGWAGISTGNSGGFGKVSVIPDNSTTSLTTSLTFGQAENFQGAGERNAAWLLRGPGLGGLPGTYDTAGNYTANVGNPVDGLVFITTPNFTLAGANFGQNGGATGFIHGAPGSPVVPVRGDLLGATSLCHDRRFRHDRRRKRWHPHCSPRPPSIRVRALRPRKLVHRPECPRHRGAGSQWRHALSGAENGERLQPHRQRHAAEYGSGFAGRPQRRRPPDPHGRDGDRHGQRRQRLPHQWRRLAYVHGFGDVTFSGKVFSDNGLVKTGERLRDLQCGIARCAPRPHRRS